MITHEGWDVVGLGIVSPRGANLVQYVNRSRDGLR
jgi:hypothetical protein